MGGKIMSINKAQVDLMIKVIGIDTDAEDKIRQSLKQIEEINTWKASLCGKWTNETKDLIKIRLNNKRMIVFDMHSLGKPSISGYITAIDNNYTLHFNGSPGSFGTLCKEVTSEVNCSILTWDYNQSKIRWFSSNKDIEEIMRWLTDMELGSYLKKFQEKGYLSMSQIRSLNKVQVREMCYAVGCKQGAALKVQYDLGVLTKDKKEWFDPYAACHWNTELKKNKAPDHFERLGNDFYEEEKYPQATFYYFQHKVHELGGQDYDQVEMAASKCGETWKEFTTFLVKQFSEGYLRYGTDWIDVVNGYKKYLQPKRGGFAEVYEWLKSLKIEKYAPRFEEEEYISMELIRGLNDEQVDEMIKLIGCKGGATAKIQQDLQVGVPKRKKWVKFDPEGKLKLKAKNMDIKKRLKKIIIPICRKTIVNIILEM